MASKYAALYVCFAIAFAIAGCGGDELSTGTSIRAFDPSCGSSCPDNCWTDVYKSTRLAQLWIFHANQLNETNLRAGSYLLVDAVDDYQAALQSFIPQTVPATVYASWTLPSSFTLVDDDLEGNVVLGNGGGTLRCGTAYFE